MKIEILYPELCNLYGDCGNVKYLKENLPKAKFIYTELNDKPYFVENDIDLIYMGSMTEKSQERIISKLKPYKTRIKELIDNNKIFLLFGNSFEIFNNYIIDSDNKINGLGILNFYSKRNLKQRHNSLFIGTFENKEIVGYTSRFSHTYGDNSQNYLFQVKKGTGINEETNYEGIRINNLFASYLLGPLLVNNPEFMEYILKLLGIKKLKYKNIAKKVHQSLLEDTANYFKKIVIQWTEPFLHFQETLFISQLLFF